MSKPQRRFTRLFAVTLATLAASLGASGSALAAGAPVVTAEAATGLVRNGAMTEVTLNGTVNANGNDTHYYFEYGESFPLSSQSPAPPGADVGEKEEAIHVQTTVSVPTGHKFTFYLVATNNEGTSTASENFTAPAVEGVETLAATNVQANSAVLHGSLEPNGVDTHYHFECEYEAAIGRRHLYVPAFPGRDAGAAFGTVDVEAELSAIGGGSQYYCALVAINEFGSTEGSQVVVETSHAPPIVDVSAPTVEGLTTSGAVLDSAVTTQNEATSYWIEYVLASAYEAAAPNPYANGVRSPAQTLAGETRFSTPTLVALEGLMSDTTYHYRLVAENGTGTTYGADHTFTTVSPMPPLVTTGSANGVSTTTATISGTVDPQGLQTSYEFEIGATTSYGDTEIFGNGGDGEVAEMVDVALEYLVPGTTYHYRLVATNADGTSYGPDETFTTGSVQSPIGRPSSASLLSFVPVAFPDETEKVKQKARSEKGTTRARHKHRKKKGRKSKRGKRK